ncbi:hypothetical protein D3C86_284100 [compost metagenome]
MGGTMVVNGVHAAYSMVKARDGKRVLAYVRDATSGLWELVGTPGAAFPSDAEARAAIRGQIAERITSALRQV